MRLRAVMFDLGHTLVDFRFDEDMWLDCLRSMLDATGLEGGSAERLRAELRARLDAFNADPDDHSELVYHEVVDEALRACGHAVPAAAVRAAIEAEHRAWDPARHLHPEALGLLDAIRERGLGLGIVSNTHDPPDLLHADIAGDGIADRVDAVVFSSELGRRKPAPEIYRAVLDALGVAPAEALFVGDRVREDIVGPASLGMHTCLVTYFRTDEGDHRLADAVASTPAEVLAVVDGLLTEASPGTL